VVATVVSRPTQDRAVIDAGSKVLALDRAEGQPGHGYLVGHPGAQLARLSEEHGVVQLPAGERGLRVGERVEVIPNHICPVVNLMDALTVVRQGRVQDVWPVAARGRVR
jgi:D-serine deaminase-like pyridoxal phosphate-dependent protein